MGNESEALALAVMACRYAYYVECAPLVPDVEYDRMERRAREVCGAESPVHRVGSDRERDYSEDTKALARRMRGGV